MLLHEFQGVYMLKPESMPFDLDIVFHCVVQNLPVIVLPVEYYEAMLEHLPEGLRRYPIDQSLNPYQIEFVKSFLGTKYQDHAQIQQAFEHWRLSKKEEYRKTKCSYDAASQRPS